jgi:hypothetical protein
VVKSIKGKPPKPSRSTFPVPTALVNYDDESPKFCLRFHGKLPMAGVRVADVYHVLWIEPQFGRLYGHG